MFMYNTAVIYSPSVYDSGSVFDPSVLDITNEDILKRFMEVSDGFTIIVLQCLVVIWLSWCLSPGYHQHCLSVAGDWLCFSQSMCFHAWLWCDWFVASFQGIANVASVSLEIGYPTVASAPHSIINGFKVCVTWCLLQIRLVHNTVQDSKLGKTLAAFHQDTNASQLSTNPWSTLFFFSPEPGCSCCYYGNHFPSSGEGTVPTQVHFSDLSILPMRFLGSTKGMV